MQIPPKIVLRTIIGLIVVIAVSRTIDLLLAYQHEGQWATFDSISRAKPPQDPDGYRIDYPTNWNVIFRSGGGSKNLRNRRGSFQSPWESQTYLNIWWRRVDPHWTLDDAQTWFENELGIGIRDKEIKEKHNRWRTEMVGKGQYPALVQTYYDTTSAFQFSDLPNDQTRVVLLIVGDEAFALTFHDDDVDPETTAIFQRMLDSFEVYK